MAQPQTHLAAPTAQRGRILSMLRGIFSTLLGVTSAELDDDKTFLELGAESMQLLQAGQALQDTFGIRIAFRLLLEELSTINALADYLEPKLATVDAPASPVTVSAVAAAPIQPVAETATSAPLPPVQPLQLNGSAQFPPPPTTHTAHTNGAAVLPAAAPGGGNSLVERIMTQQLQIMAQQLELLRGKRTGAPSATNGAAPVMTPLPTLPGLPAQPKLENIAQPVTSPDETNGKPQSSEFVAYQPIRKGARGGLTERQQQHLAELTARLTSRLHGSKAHTQEYRAHLADNRVVTGFRSSWKELCFPFTIARGEGGRIWDIDGNEYVDLTMGFGALLFGHSPDFLINALAEDVPLGMRLGPQSYLAGKVAKLLCEITHTERAAFCNSGTEAIMTALRLARAVSGRSLVVLFPGSFHGTFDGTLVRGEEMADGQLKAVPMAPGILPSMVQDVKLLRYDHPESIAWLEEHGHEVAAVLIEPPRSRRPDIHPADFLRELRRVTQAKGAALIFDEVVTGFRSHPGGIQALFDIQADMVTYGKAVAGGMPIGIVAGKARYLDAIDGGMWQYGDDSFPEADTTFFAGTFCKHPLTMAVTWAVLNHLKEQGPQLQEQLNARTAALVATLNAYLTTEQAPIEVIRFGSLFRFYYAPELRYMDLFFFHMLEQGVYIWEGRNCFLSTAHTEEDVAQIIRAVKASVTAMRDGGFLPMAPTAAGQFSLPVINGGVDGAKMPSATRQIPLTEAQKQLWFIAQTSEQASVAYNLSVTLKLTGTLNWNALYHALQGAVARHDALRITFSPQGDQQRVAPTLHLDVPLTDLSHLAAQERETQAAQILGQTARTPFDLVRGPLLRVHLIRLAADQHLLALTVHHLVADGQSLGIILKDISTLYIDAQTGTSAQLAPATQFSEYVTWQLSQQQNQAMTAAESYWLNRFAGPLPVLELPTDHPRPPVQTHRGDRYTMTFDTPLRNALQRLGAQQNCTLFVVLLTGFKTLLHRLTDQTDLVVGIPAAGQFAMGGKDLVGYCINLLPVRTAAQEEKTFVEYLQTVKSALLDAYEHQQYPFNYLIKRLNPHRDPSRTPLVSVAFNLDHASSAPTFGNLQAAFVPNHAHTAQFDIDLNITDTGSELKLECEYNSDLFDAQTMGRWLGHLQTLLTHCASDARQPLGTVELLSAAERQQLLVAWNASQAPFPEQAAFPELFEAQVQRTPRAVAATFAGQKVTYQELNARANRLARLLVAQGVERNVVVGLLASRSIDFLTAILAVFKAGGAYLPLDPLYPTRRLLQAMTQSRAPLLLAAEEFQPLVEQALAHQPTGQQPRVFTLESLLREPQPEENLPRRSEPGDLAYVIYTSGSTGQPKGAMVEQRGMINHLYAKVDALALTASDRVAQTASQCFDISVWQFLVSLIVGGEVQILPDAIAHHPALLLETVEQTDTTILETVPSLLRLMLDEVARRGSKRPSLAALRWLIPTGEALPPALCRQWLQFYPTIPLMNAYGPTECSDDVAHYPISEPPAAEVIHTPVGRPVINTQLYVLNRQLQPALIGVPGELYVGGVGVGRGYLHDPVRTAEVFRPDPFSAGKTGKRLYKTGDLARYRPDGNLEFLGRIDHQVKVRGFRIELGEIETALAQHPTLREVVVVAREDTPGDKRLVAYIAPHQQPGPTVTELRTHLKDRLPEYMIPAAFVSLTQLPLTPNGKIDRNALPAPDHERPAVGKTFTPPLTMMEKQLAQIWAQTLNLTQVGVDDNFFDLGGDSILSIQIVARAYEAGIHLNPQYVFQYQTIAELARVASTTQATPGAQAEQGLVTGPMPLTPIQHWFFAEELPEPHYFNLFSLQETRQPLEIGLLTRAFEHLLAHHDALRMRFRREDASWRAENAGLDTPFAVEAIDLSAIPAAEQAAAIEREATRLQSSLNLAHGPLLRVGLMNLGAHRPGRLFIAVHHLAMDIYSWRVLFEQLQAVYKQLRRGEAVQLPPKTTSFQAWAKRLNDYAQTNPARQELTYWLNEAPAQLAPLPLDYPSGREANTESSMRFVEMSLDSATTQALLQEAPKVYHTQINDVLLTALVQAFAGWTGKRTLLIDLEGHGREPLFEDVNLTRTIGWFTAIFPVLLDPGTDPNPGAALKKIKEHLRSIPHGGIGYGILRYLCADAAVAEQLQARPAAEVCFNYAGQGGQSGQNDEAAWLVPAAESCGPEHGQRGRRHYLLEVNGAVREGQLTMVWAYSENLHRRATIEKLAQAFMDALRTLVAHCQSPEAGGVTASDFGLAKLKQNQLAGVLAKVKFAGSR